MQYPLLCVSNTLIRRQADVYASPFGIVELVYISLSRKQLRQFCGHMWDLNPSLTVQM